EIRMLFSHALKLRGYQVVEASDGALAVEAAERYRPDLVIIDLMMPAMNGIEASKKIRQLPYLQQVPIICVTAYESSQLLSEEDQDLWQVVMRKPVKLSALQAEVARFLRK
ncbi:MAG: response regulator, partial [Blastocatellia bacterium]|nr:response regulator [Blastocatellia bacterium]